MSHELSVSIARRGAKVDLDMESAAFGVISIDGEQIPAEERPGTAKKLLASSALYCYCAALDKALALSPEDPALLQERAEIAVLQKDLDKAGALASNAYALGAKVGPLCRRHWATIRQQLALRQRRLELPEGGKRLKRDQIAQWQRDQSDTNVAIAEAARHQADCTLTGPPRY